MPFGDYGGPHKPIELKEGIDPSLFTCALKLEASIDEARLREWFQEQQEQDKPVTFVLEGVFDPDFTCPCCGR